MPERAVAHGVTVATIVIAAAVIVALSLGGKRFGDPEPEGSTAPSATNHSGRSAAQVRKRVEPVARRFLASYLPLIYGRRGAKAARLPDADPKLVRALQEQPGRVPPGQAALTPRITRLRVVPGARDTARVTAYIKDTRTSPYPLVLDLTQGPDGGWAVTGLASKGPRLAGHHSLSGPEAPDGR